MKKVFFALFIVCLLVMAGIPALGFLAPSEAAANEQLAPTPQWQNEDGSWNKEYFTQLVGWFSDHFFGRQELISCNNFLTANILKTSQTDSVVLGKDGWLYYQSTMADYTDAAPFTDRQLFAITNNLSLMQQYCQENGRQFAFVIAPNKNSLYADAMTVPAAQTRNAQRLLDSLRQNGVSVADLYEAFGAQDEILYFAHDSHWNSKGAALGADCINAALGKESRYYLDAFAGQTSHRGDLYDMLYPAFADPEKDFVYGGKLAFTYTSKATKPDSNVLTTQSDADGSLLCYRDSFGNLLYPYLADSYGQCRFSRAVSYDLTLPSDAVVIELVERNLLYLTKYLPVMEAPQRQVRATEPVGTVAVEQSGTELLRVTGTLPVQPDDDSPVYIFCGETAYEAFCLENGGFGAHLPAGAEVTAVACYAGGVLQTFTESQ